LTKEINARRMRGVCFHDSAAVQRNDNYGKSAALGAAGHHAAGEGDQRIQVFWRRRDVFTEFQYAFKQFGELHSVSGCSK
jgi:hypothetical protein